MSVNRDFAPHGSYEVTIHSVTESDAGSYSAVATNTVGTEECSSAVTVKGEDCITGRTQLDIRCSAITACTLCYYELCHSLHSVYVLFLMWTDAKDVFSLLKPKTEAVAAGEEPTFTWFKSGQEFDPEDRFKVLYKDEEDTLALVFQHINPEDAGLYTCVAATSTGKISCSAELSVEGGVQQLLKVTYKLLIA